MQVVSSEAAERRLFSSTRSRTVSKFEPSCLEKMHTIPARGIRKARMRDTYAFRRTSASSETPAEKKAYGLARLVEHLSWRPQTQPRGTHTQAEKKDEDRQLLSQPRNGSRRTTLKPASASCHFLFTGPARPGPM